MDPHKSNMCDEGSTKKGDLKQNLNDCGEKPQKTESQEENMTHSEEKTHKHDQVLTSEENNCMFSHTKRTFKTSLVDTHWRRTSQIQCV